MSTAIAGIVPWCANPIAASVCAASAVTPSVKRTMAGRPDSCSGAAAARVAAGSFGFETIAALPSGCGSPVMTRMKLGWCSAAGGRMITRKVVSRCRAARTPISSRAEAIDRTSRCLTHERSLSVPRRSASRILGRSRPARAMAAASAGSPGRGCDAHRGIASSSNGRTAARAGSPASGRRGYLTSNRYASNPRPSDASSDEGRSFR